MQCVHILIYLILSGSSCTEKHIPVCLPNLNSPLLFSHLIILSLFISHSEYKEDIVFNQFVDKLP